MMTPAPPHIAHCLTGSIAAKLYGKFSQLYDNAGCSFEMLATEAAAMILQRERTIANQWFKVLRDQDEWDDYTREDAVLHIELMKRADVLVVAPLTANTLAKIANGISDNLVTCVIRAWPVGKPIVLAPAMNTQMWENPVTEEHLERLRSRYGKTLTVVQPQAKTLFCGDVGLGAMAQAENIVRAAQECYQKL